MNHILQAKLYVLLARGARDPNNLICHKKNYKKYSK